METAVGPLIHKVRSTQIPAEFSELIIARLEQLELLSQSSSFLPELDKMTRYIDWVTSLPWNKKTKDILDLKHAKSVMDKHHYGLDSLKERILEYISIMKLKEGNSENKESITRTPILCFVGLVGTGKTTFAYSIAEALGRKIARIPFGGMGDPLDLRGQSRMHPEAEPGRVIKALRQTHSKNSVILLDEIDRVADEGRASIMGVLVELLDTKQNHAFVDHYIDYPFDLSEVIFIATANNTTNIATAVMDRLEPISMPSYTDQEKIVIARDYILPQAIKEAGLPKGTVTFDESVWISMVRPLGYDAGIRTMERTVKGAIRKIAKLYVEGEGKHFAITPENIKQFLPQW